MTDVYAAPSRDGNRALFVEALETLRAQSFPTLVTGPWDDREGGAVGLHVRGSEEDLERFRVQFEARLRVRFQEAPWCRSRDCR